MENTLDNIKLGKEVSVVEIGCSRKSEKKNIRFRNNRRNKDKTSF